MLISEDCSNDWLQATHHPSVWETFPWGLCKGISQHSFKTTHQAKNNVL